MKTQKRALFAAMIVIWIILGLQLAASQWSLYWVLPWFDILMHFLGGLWLGLMIFALLSKPIPYLLEHAGLLVIVVVSGTLFFGFLWEIMEFVLDVMLGTNMFQPNLPDTLSDLGFDMIGSVVAALGIFVYRKKAHE